MEQIRHTASEGTLERITWDVVQYTSSLGSPHVAVYIEWPDVTAWLERPHEGSDDDQALVEALLAAGAPEWVRDASGWVDEIGWGLIGPTLKGAAR